MGRKRKLRELGASFVDFKQRIVGSESVDSSEVVQWKNHLIDNRDNEELFSSLKNQLDNHFLTALLSKYNASESEIDTAIYSLLCALERSCHFNLRPLYPLIWGSKAKENYENLRKFGQNLYNRPTANQVLDYLDARRMWATLLRSRETSVFSTNYPNPEALYDARFILRLIASLLEPGNEMSTRKFIEVNGLSFAFAATAFVNRTERCVAYLILKRFLFLLLDLNTEDFPEKCLYIYILKVFRNSVERPAQRLPHAVAHFFARVTKLFIHPEDPVYQPIILFLVLKPTFDLENVPEIYKLLLSSSTQYHQQERHWILRLFSESLIEPNDYNILQKRYGIKLCLSLFGSNMVEMESRKLILLTLRSALQHRSIANDLFFRQHLHSWIASCIKNVPLTRWEVVFLSQLFVTLIENVKITCSAAVEKANHETKFRNYANFNRILCKMSGNVVLDALSAKKDASEAALWNKLNQLLNEEWFQAN